MKRSKKGVVAEIVNVPSCWCVRPKFPRSTSSKNPSGNPREILGEDFISPQEITAACGISYTRRQLGLLNKNLPRCDQLNWLKNNGYVLMPGPSQPMNLLEVRNLRPHLFAHIGQRLEAVGQKLTEKQSATRETVGCTWVMLPKGPISTQTIKSWGCTDLKEVQSLLQNVAEVSWFIMLYYLVRGARLFSDTYAQTSSIEEKYYRIVVGRFAQKDSKPSTERLSVELFQDCAIDPFAVGMYRLSEVLNLEYLRACFV